MIRLSFAICVALVAALAAINSAHAAFVLVDNPALDPLNFSKASNQATFFGTVLSPNDISFSATGNVDVASGNAIITPIKMAC
jgi:hypothetical protein